MKHVLVFDANCSACTAAALTTSDNFDARLEIRPRSDTWVLETLAAAGLSLPSGPALIREDDEGEVTVVDGFRMRAALVRLLGPARTHRALRLMVAETRARAARSTSGHGLSRRKLLGLLGFGVGSSILGIPETARAAPVTRDTLTRVMALSGMQRAVSQYGQIIPESVVEAAEAGEHIIMLNHDSGAVTILDAAAKSNPTITTVIASAKGAARTLKFSDGATGQVLGDLTQTAPGAALVGTPAGTEENVSNGISFIRQVCFVGCMAGKTSESCFNHCFNCFVSGNYMSCVAAAVCGGAQFNKCRKEC